MEKVENEYLIGIDAGTTYVKAALFDLEGRELFKKGTPTNISSPDPRWIEADMAILWEYIKKCLKELIAAAKINSKKIAGIGLTATGDGTWMIDYDENPVRPGILWCDGRSEIILNGWLSDGTAEKAFDICGTAIHTGSQCTQLKWLKEHEPECLKRTKAIFHCKDWLFYKFTGKITTDETDESLTFLNIKSRQYDDELFKLFDIYEYSDKFPTVNHAEENTGTILGGLAKEFNLSKDLIIGSGPMDVLACAVGGGAIKNGDACSIIGSAGINEVVTGHPLLYPRMVGMNLCHAPKDKWIRLIAAMSATPNLDWFIKEFGAKYKLEAEEKGIKLIKYVDKIVENIPAGCEGVLYHPYIFPGGERGPFVVPNANASFTGLSINHSIDFLLRSIYEGVGFSMLDCYKNMPVEINEIILTGGGAKSNIWCQIISDITGKVIKIPGGEEYGAKGAALNVGVALGIYKDFEEAVLKTVKTVKTYLPDSLNNRKYQEIYEVYKMTYEKMMDVWNKRSSVYIK